MDRLDDIDAFLAVVEQGSQTAAARHLRRSLQSINRSLATLEQSVGVDLVQRSTRRSSPTEAGLAFYHRVRPAFTEIVDARIEAASKRAEPSGVLRISAPVLFAPAYVVPAICDFMEHYPQIEIELKVSDARADLFEDGLELAIRIGDLPDSELKVRRLGELRVVVFGAPAYFARHGRPKHPDDLAQHRCIIRLTEGRDEAWRFRIGGRNRAVRVRGPFRTDSMAAMHRAVARGLGLGYTPLWQIRSLIDHGDVETVLAEFETARIPIYAVSPPARIPRAKVQLFTDFLATELKGALL
jgi:DNA-binding transcriptional LysR family regulator